MIIIDWIIYIYTISPHCVDILWFENMKTWEKVASNMIIRKIGIATRNDNNAIIYANIVINVMNSNEGDQVQDAYVFLLSVL